MAKKSKSKKAIRAEQKARETRMKQIRYGGIAVLVIGAFIALALIRNAGVVPADELAAITPPLLDGPEDAPVRVVEYADLACSACRQWHNLGIKQQIKQEFGDQVSFEYRHFPVITANSPKAAEAAQCAAEQDSFWEYHDYIYENLGEYPNFTSSLLKEVADGVNLERDSFDSCLDSGKYRNFVKDAEIAARNAGATGTPTFMINGRTVNPNFDTLSQAIAQELN